MKALWPKLICTLCLAHLFLHSVCQKYNYVSYSTRDGLAGNMVYDMCQDYQGFLWFGTDNGLSRFDGKNFKNFTVKDGLPDNEVLLLFEDSKQRLWVGAFKNEMCFYQNGRFYRSGVDTIFSGISIKSRPSLFYEDAGGTLWIFCEKQIFLWSENGRIEEIEFQPSLSDRVQKLSIVPYFDGNTYNTYIGFNDSLFRFSRNGVLYHVAPFRVVSNEISIRTFGDNKVSRMVQFKNDVVRLTFKDRKPHLVATVDGAFELNPENWQKVDSFLIGKGVTRVIMDKEGIYWFSTLGDGVYKLVSKSSIIQSFEEGLSALNEVFCILAEGDQIYTGHGGSRLVTWTKHQPPKSDFFGKYLRRGNNVIATNRLKAIKRMPDSTWLFGFDGFLMNWNGQVKDFLELSAIKTIEFLGNDSILVATGGGVFQISLKAFKGSEKIWPSRATCAVRLGEDYYIGTVDGLFRKDSFGKVEFAGDVHPSLKRRIAALSIHGNDLWVATSDSGLVCLRNGKLHKAISETHGLSSNICRAMEIEGNYLWVGTNKGVNKVSFTDSLRKEIIIYNSLNILPGDAISSLFVNNKKVYVGTPEGLTFFEEAALENKLFCNLQIDGARVGDNFYFPGDTAIVGYDNNRIEIYLSGISTLASGSISFSYKLVDFDLDWIETNENVIVYSNLPPGSYTLEVQAENIFGAKSDIHKMHINVNAPFWYSYKFWIFSILIFGGVAGFIFYKNAKRKQFKLEQQLSIERQMADLEQRALQSQMNPHFIFNSLNSIQQFILTNNVKDANKFLTIFGGLIRETMEFSTQGTISLQQEIQYIEKYLQLEQMRFGQKFQFKVEALNIEHVARLPIPGMLIQPFVENAVRHGIRYREDDKGFIYVSFKIEEEYLLCCIRDNGIGIKASKSMKTKQHIEYQSRGMDLTEKRIAMFNKVYGEKVSMRVVDLKDRNFTDEGTEVLISIKIDSDGELDSGDYN